MGRGEEIPKHTWSFLRGSILKSIGLLKEVANNCVGNLCANLGVLLIGLLKIASLEQFN